MLRRPMKKGFWIDRLVASPKPQDRLAYGLGRKRVYQTGHSYFCICFELLRHGCKICVVSDDLLLTRSANVEQLGVSSTAELSPA